MKSLADLLLNHKVPGVRDAQIRHSIAEELSSMFNIPILPKQVRYKDADLVLAVPPVVKSMIRLRSTEIVEKLKERDIPIATIK